MKALFEDVPEAISNTLEVAEKCTLQLDFKTKHYPVYIPSSLAGKTYTPEERKQASANYLKQLCQEG